MLHSQPSTCGWRELPEACSVNFQGAVWGDRPAPHNTSCVGFCPFFFSLSPPQLVLPGIASLKPCLTLNPCLRAPPGGIQPKIRIVLRVK